MKKVLFASILLLFGTYLSQAMNEQKILRMIRNNEEHDQSIDACFEKIFGFQCCVKFYCLYFSSNQDNPKFYFSKNALHGFIKKEKKD